MSAVTTVKETIVVEGLGKYGPKVSGKFYNLSKKSGLELKHFTPGHTYDVIVYTSASGTKYINQLVGEVVGAAAPAVEEAPVSNVSSTTDKVAYWDKKNDAQKLGGLFHDAAQITAAIVMAEGANVDRALEIFGTVIDRVVEIRNRMN